MRAQDTTSSLRWGSSLLALLCLSGAAACAARDASADQIAWLRARSMLAQADELAHAQAGRGEPWRRPYAQAQPRAAAATASAWFTAYPAATLARPGQTVVQALAEPELWRLLSEIGVRGLHTGPLKLAGGVSGQTFTPTIDGNFDRIGMAIDPAFGDRAQYLTMSAAARAHGAIVIGDIIPGHTGKGPDFRLAEHGVAPYPGIYHMVSLPAADWGLLPAVPAGRDSVNLPPATVAALAARGHIVGALPRVIFFEPGVKESNWSATDVVRGADGVERRWVYLHYFKDGQPTLNWLDPTFAGPRLVIGDLLDSLTRLGVGMVRLDANGFLGIEVGPPGGPAWSEGHPLSLTANQLIAGMVRKLGGFSFQELNLTLEDIRDMSRGGADLAYDFVTRPAIQHALLTGDAAFLRLMLAQMHALGIDPAGLIHALQNHDELTLELVHFWTTHRDQQYEYQGQRLSGAQLRDRIRAEVHERLLAPAAPYNLKAANDVSCTTASLAAAALGIRELRGLSAEQREQIQRAHLLLVVFAAFQPGVFALSGWDLVGALPLAPESVADLMADGDTRWINRGAYDLLGVAPAAERSAAGLPRAVALYGSLPEQLARPDSFASQLRRLLAVRAALRLPEARQLPPPAVQAPGLVVLVHELPADVDLAAVTGRGAGSAGPRAFEVTVLNVGRQASREVVKLPVGAGMLVRDLLSGGDLPPVGADGGLSLELPPLGTQVLLLYQR